MSLCERCSKGGYHGYRRDECPSTVYFWCPVRESHDPGATMCPDFEHGEPGKFDKRGERMDS